MSGRSRTHATTLQTGTIRTSGASESYPLFVECYGRPTDAAYLPASPPSRLAPLQNAVMSSSDYMSDGQKVLDNMTSEGYYISPAFMDKMAGRYKTSSNCTSCPVHFRH